MNLFDRGGASVLSAGNMCPPPPEPAADTDALLDDFHAAGIYLADERAAVAPVAPPLFTMRIRQPDVLSETLRATFRRAGLPEETVVSVWNSVVSDDILFRIIIPGRAPVSLRSDWPVRADDPAEWQAWFVKIARLLLDGVAAAPLRLPNEPGPDYAVQVPLPRGEMFR